MTTAVIVFALTYVLISARRMGTLGIDRPTGAMLGAVTCVFVGVLSPKHAIGAVDGATLLLLFGMMGMGAFLAMDGFFDRAADALAAWARTPARLLGALVWGSGALAALVTNDAVCVLGAPLVVGLIGRCGLKPAPFLLALATASNTGSVATLVGNPQNMLCAQLGGLAYRDHLLLVGPAAVLCLAANHAILAWAFRRELAGTLPAAGPAAPVLTGPSRVTLGVIGLSAVCYTLGTDLAFTAAAGCVALLLVHRGRSDELWRHIDWSILLFFAGLFIVVEGLSASGASAALFARFPLVSVAGTAAAESGAAELARLSAIFLIGSNLVSNVPFILVVREPMGTLPDPRLAWELLAVASTFAGNLTLLGSVANIIVAEKAKGIGGLGFLEHLKVGAPIAVATTALGTAWIVAFGR